VEIEAIYFEICDRLAKLRPGGLDNEYSLCCLVIFMLVSGDREARLETKHAATKDA
jgi:hypothetical protein